MELFYLKYNVKLKDNNSSNEMNNRSRLKSTKLIVDELRNQGLDVELCKRYSKIREHSNF